MRGLFAEFTLSEANGPRTTDKDGHCVSLHSIAARPSGRNQNGLLRVLRPFKASTQRPRRISVTSVLSFSWSRSTQRRYWFEKKSSHADKKFGNSI
jgi:hypothetical protein